jgi:asparagine synthase (glutamine-hydrolysing)
MCGICGVINITSSDNENIVRVMNNAIIHRGPDDDGFYFDGKLALAMRRLSIIDLHGGKQPIFNEAKSVLAFQNGEIYNFLELKETLINKGHTFSSKSDTEVLVHLYEEYGEKMFSYVKGMFAVCIYDIKKDLILLARDRFGEKPLYYNSGNNQLIYSSEVKSLLSNPNVPRRLNHDALRYYLKFGYVPDPLTLLDQVFSLEPGHFLKLENGNISKQKYFEIKYETDHSYKSDKDVIEPLLSLMKQAVTRQMISDVPIGAFLSGGIDSSSLVALMQMESSSKIKTFNVKFEESTYDESPIARKVAKHLETDHHEIFVPNKKFDQEIFWNILDHVGLPFSDTSSIPTYFITKEIRKYVKVAISGDGGDELFGGYSTFPWYQKLRKFQRYKFVPAGVIAKSLKELQKLPLGSKSSKIRQLYKAFSFISKDKETLARNILELFDDKQLDEIFINKNCNSFNEYHKFNEGLQNISDLREIMNYRLKFNLPADMLIKVDRMSMANSLEVRAPFLDVDLFEFSTTLQDKFLIKNGIGKYILRETMKPYLPAEVFNHPKSGFGIPIHTYMNEEYENLCNQVLIKDHALNSVLDFDYIIELKEFGLQNKTDNSMITVYKSGLQLWSILQLYAWVKKYNVEV